MLHACLSNNWDGWGLVWVYANECKWDTHTCFKLSQSFYFTWLDVGHWEYSPGVYSTKSLMANLLHTHYLIMGETFSHSVSPFPWQSREGDVKVSPSFQMCAWYKYLFPCPQYFQESPEFEDSEKAQIMVKIWKEKGENRKIKFWKRMIHTQKNRRK